MNDNDARRERATAIVDQLLDDDLIADGWEGIDVGPSDRWLLVEISTHPAQKGARYLSVWVEREDAARQWIGQECFADWAEAELIDLDTGDTYTAELTATWRRAT